MASFVYREKLKDRNTSAAAQSVAVQKNSVSNSPYTDNRPEALLQRKVQRMATMQQAKRISAQSFISQELANKTAIAQREKIRIGTGGDREGSLTYTPSGTIRLANGTSFQGIVLVLIDIPEQDRKQGFGAALMKYFMEKVVGNKPCYLDVLAVGDKGMSNEQLEAWYQKYGFQTLGRSSTGPVMGANVPVAKPVVSGTVVVLSGAGDEKKSNTVKLVDYSDSDSD